MNEAKSIDWISEFIAKNKSRIHSIDIGYPSSDSVQIFMDDDHSTTYWDLWIKETEPTQYQLFGNPEPSNVHRRFTWVDVLLIHLRCGMKPPRMSVNMYYVNDIYTRAEARRDPVVFLRMLQLKDYSVELNEVLLNFIMSDPKLIKYVMMDSAERYVREISRTAIRSAMMKSGGIYGGGTLSKSGLMDINERYIDLFVSGLVDMRELIIKKRIEYLISDEEVSPELKMFFIRWNMEHFGSSGENETLRL
jgi:hypothetical protein